jgi:ABC-type glycerol-3-phosphate transport system substrate-binding protein
LPGFAAALFAFPLYAPPLYAGGQQTGREQITMWFWGAAPEYRMVLEEALVKPYNASQDTYELVVSYNNAVDNNIATALAADGGNAPDIVYGSGPAFVSQYAQAGKLLDLTPYSTQYGWIERIMPAIYEAGKVNGKLYVSPAGPLPWGYSTIKRSSRISAQRIPPCPGAFLLPSRNLNNLWKRH